jgi:hypothetical protein
MRGGSDGADQKHALLPRVPQGIFSGRKYLPRCTLYRSTSKTPRRKSLPQSLGSQSLPRSAEPPRSACSGSAPTAAHAASPPKSSKSAGDARPCPTSIREPQTRSSAMTSTGCRADGHRHLGHHRRAVERGKCANIARAIGSGSLRLLSAANLLEASMLIESRKGEAGGRELDLLLYRATIEIRCRNTMTAYSIR